MVNISIKSMLEAGVHFGHQKQRWNPKMARFIFVERNNIHIIDLQKTAKELKKAYQFVKETAAKGEILFVGTKKQAQEITRSEAERCGSPYVCEKWLGGTMTNFATIRKSIGRLEELERWERDGIMKVLSKKELSRLSKEMLRLKKLLTGIRSMKQLPAAVFVIDPEDEEGCVLEARKLKIPIVAVCDTNCDPDMITYPVPGNDDAARSIKLFCGIIAEAVLEGKGPKVQPGAEAQPVAEAPASGADESEPVPVPDTQEAPSEAPSEESPEPQA